MPCKKSPSRRWLIALRLLLMVILAVASGYGVYHFGSVTTDPSQRTGTELEFSFKNISSISFTSNRPVTASGHYYRHFILYNDETYETIEGTLSPVTKPADWDHEWYYKADPKTVSRGHWRIIENGTDNPRSPVIRLQSSSPILLTTYPLNNERMWVLFVLAGIVVWIFGSIILNKIIDSKT